MTGYLRYLGRMVTDPTQRTHWEWYARGERHTRDLIANPAVINGSCNFKWFSAREVAPLP
jgi:hypothetical protein